MCAVHNQRFYNQSGRRPKHPFTCRVCGKLGASPNKKAQAHSYCQRITTVIKDRKLSSCTDLVHIPKRNTYPPINVIRGTWFQSGPCAACGNIYVDLFRSSYCSEFCRPIKKRPKISKGLKRRILKRDKGICQICLLPVETKWQDGVEQPYYLELDHVIPWSKGGPTSFHNLQVTHRICNGKKSDLLI
jgi:5-methylcytosine-specific restriction endonuclease McrA